MKTRANFSIDEDIKKDFDKLCDEKAINRSKWLENKMKELLKEYEKENSTKK